MMNLAIKAFLVCIILAGKSEGIRRHLTPLKSSYKVACIAEHLQGTEHFVCDVHGHIYCLPGWSDETDECRTPVCHNECAPGQGKCTAPNVCTCEIGWTGPSCSQCIRLPGCEYGNCSRPFECNCKEGWTGMFCDKPKCKDGCIHGQCSSPGECTCHPGWWGENCDRCVKLPGCSRNGYCDKPMSCKCKPGYGGNYCLDPICSPGCHPEYGFCTKPDVCWCHPGWKGQNCTECVPYPGCVNGICEGPWECKCKPGFSGKLCNIEGKEPVAHGPRNVEFFQGFPVDIDEENPGGLFDLSKDNLAPSPALEGVKHDAEEEEEAVQ